MRTIAGIIFEILGIIATAFGVISKLKGITAVSIIGGADGPTSIFVAGKVGGDFLASAILIGIVLIGIGSVCLFYKRK